MTDRRLTPEMAVNPAAVQMQQQQQQQQSIPQHPQHPQQQTPQGNTHDHVSQVRVQVQQLKESLANLMRISASAIGPGQHSDVVSKAGDGRHKFDRSLEDFFFLTNQIERHLRTISECVVQQRASNKYMQFAVSGKLETSGPIELTDGTISYNQYMTIMNHQTKYAKAIQDILIDGVQKMNSHTVPTESGSSNAGVAAAGTSVAKTSVPAASSSSSSASAPVSAPP